ncbi:hypothetical protein HHK36_032657 [Tetracentron sinense]|uniref:Gamma-glutamyl peptidase 5-like n=1 Tax=Tetracentron sinense TaxID=13715 RepID=A0A835D080_TETSI|nr:hypothetical protein HHK36_032657 [Tetracentron sinense]
MGGKRFGVLLCAEDSEYVKKKYGGYFGVYVEMLGEEGEIWDVYKVVGGEFPGEEELGFYDGFVITGSCHDAHGNDVWICKLLNLLKKLDSMKKKVLGFCFGHQILKLALEERRAEQHVWMGCCGNCPRAEVRAWSEKKGIEMFPPMDGLINAIGFEFLAGFHAEARRASVEAREPDERLDEIVQELRKGRL